MRYAFDAVRRTCAFLVAMLCLVVTGAPGAAQPLAPVAEFAVQGFFGEKKPEKDLSGIACRPPATDGSRTCLVINDESRAAQHVMLLGTSLTPGAKVPLIDSKPPTNAVGTQPKVNCRGGIDDFGEYDGEGVAFASGPSGGTYYVVGSHGCSRKKDQARLSSFLLSRISVGENGMLASPELTWRLTDALRGSSLLAPWFARSLNVENGLNIEGIAAVGPDLLFGMRAPVVSGHAFIARVSINALFAPGASGSPAAGVTQVDLGTDAGIRDMAMLPDGRLLLLSGPAQEQADVPYALWVVALGPADRPRRLGVLKDVMDGDERAKAEGIAVLDVTGGEARVLIIFDGVANGGPREYRVRLE